MEEKEFVALVDRLEDYAHRQPGAYKFRVAMLAALGYVYLLPDDRQAPDVYRRNCASALTIARTTPALSPLGAAALPLLQEIIAIEPDHAGANYNLGEALLEQGDETGIRHIELAMEKEVHATPYGCELIYDFLTSRKRREEAERYRRCITDYYKEAELAQQERVIITVKDEFTGHDLTPEIVRELCNKLSNHPDLAIVYVVRKVVQHFPQDPSYVMGVVGERMTFYSGQDEERNGMLIDKLADEVSLPGPTFIIPLENKYKALLKVFERIPGSEIYRAENYKAKLP